MHLGRVPRYLTNGSSFFPEGSNSPYKQTRAGWDYFTGQIRVVSIQESPDLKGKLGEEGKAPGESIITFEPVGDQNESVLDGRKFGIRAQRGLETMLMAAWGVSTPADLMRQNFTGVFNQYDARVPFDVEMTGFYPTQLKLFPV